MSVNDPELEFIADVKRRFEALGIGSERLKISYQDDLQDHQVLVGNGAISDEQIAGLIDVISPMIHIAFENADTYQRYAAAWLRRYPSDGGGVVGGS